MVEVQALVDGSHLPSPKRLSVGLDQQRLSMLIAVLHRHAGIGCYDQDVFVNAVGGVKITEPASDLAVMLAIAGSIGNRAMPAGLVVFGEAGLAGEIRPAPRGQERLKEAAKLGFSKAIIPRANAPKTPIEGLKSSPLTGSPMRLPPHETPRKALLESSDTPGGARISPRRPHPTLKYGLSA